MAAPRIPPAGRRAHSQGRRPNLLGPDELRAARGFSLRAGIFVLYALAPWLLGLRPGADVAPRLIVAFTMGGTFAIVVAILRGEPAGRGRLNHWDEAMAFNGLSLLTHLSLLASGHA